jgi:hypothetical protein
MISLINLDTSAVDDTYSAYGLYSGITDFRDGYFPYIFATWIFLFRSKFFLRVCARDSFVLDISILSPVGEFQWELENG